VPPGFTLSTEVCRRYYDLDHAFPEGLKGTVHRYLERVEQLMGKRFGSAEEPLLLSVRSGAPVSMPGMMDTILNLGLNDETVEGLARQADDERFAYDSYRRFVQMYGNVVKGVDGDLYEDLIEARKERAGVRDDTDSRRFTANRPGRPSPWIRWISSGGASGPSSNRGTTNGP